MVDRPFAGSQDRCRAPTRSAIRWAGRGCGSEIMQSPLVAPGCQRIDVERGPQNAGWRRSARGARERAARGVSDAATARPADRRQPEPEALAGKRRDLEAAHRNHLGGPWPKPGKAQTTACARVPSRTPASMMRFRRPQSDASAIMVRWRALGTAGGGIDCPVFKEAARPREGVGQ